MRSNNKHNRVYMQQRCGQFVQELCCLHIGKTCCILLMTPVFLFSFTLYHCLFWRDSRSLQTCGKITTPPLTRLMALLRILQSKGKLVLDNKKSAMMQRKTIARADMWHGLMPLLPNIDYRWTLNSTGVRRSDLRKFSSRKTEIKDDQDVKNNQKQHHKSQQRTNNYSLHNNKKAGRTSFLWLTIIQEAAFMGQWGFSDIWTRFLVFRWDDQYSSLRSQSI